MLVTTEPSSYYCGVDNDCKDTITMLLLAGWKRHESISAPIWSLTTRKHFRLPISHRHSVESKEQLTIRSFDTDQSQPVHSVEQLIVVKLPRKEGKYTEQYDTGEHKKMLVIITMVR